MRVTREQHEKLWMPSIFRVLRKKNCDTNLSANTKDKIALVTTICSVKKVLGFAFVSFNICWSGICPITFDLTCADVQDTHTHTHPNTPNIAPLVTLLFHSLRSYASQVPSLPSPFLLSFRTLPSVELIIHVANATNSSVFDDRRNSSIRIEDKRFHSLWNMVCCVWVKYISISSSEKCARICLFIMYS